MTGLHRLCFASILLVVSLLQPPALGDDDQEAARLARARGEVVPLEVVLAAARSAIAGKVIEVELEFEFDPGANGPARRDAGRWIYEVEVLTEDGRIVELEFDASDGKLLEVEGAPWPAHVPRPE